jgi:hypothetical protein
MVKSPARTRNSIVSIHNTSRHVLNYSTRGAYLLRRSLGDLQLLGDTFAHHIARPRWRRKETRLQASRWIVDKRNVGQSRTAEPGPQLKTLLQCLSVLLVGRIFNGDGVVTLADFTALLGLAFALALLWNIYKSRRGVGSETNFITSSCSEQFG